MKKNQKKLSIFLKLLIYFFIIIIFISIIIFFTTQFHLNFLEQKVKASYKKILEETSKYISSSLKYTYYKIINYNWYSELKDLRNSENPLKDFPSGYKFKEKTISFTFKNYWDDTYVEDIFYIHHKSNYVISNNNIEEKSSFFKNHYPDLDINKLKHISYIKTLDFPKPEYFYYNKNNYKIVMPMLFSEQGKKNNAILINISEKKIYNILKKLIPTNNSNYYIIDSNGKIIIETATTPFERRNNQIKPDNQFKNKNILDKIKSEKIFIKNIYNKKCFILSRKISKYTIDNHIYIILIIPYKDIYDQSIPVKSLSIIISILVLLFSLILSFIMSKNIYNPIKSIINLFSNSNKKFKFTNEDEFDFLSKNIKELISDKNILNQKLKNTIPLAVEHYLYKILNEKLDNNTEDRIQKFLKNHNVIFNKPYFSVLIFRLVFSNIYYEEFNNEDQLNIIKKTLQLIKNAFSLNFNMNILNINKNEFCIILNLNNNSSSKEILKSCNKIHSVFQEQNDFFNLLTGIGRIHKNLKGLKESYNEASYCISNCDPNKKSNIILFNPDIVNETNYIYTINEETQLFNYLLTSKTEEINKLLNSIIKNNKKEGISTEKQKDLFLQIYNTGIRALNKLNMNPKSIMKKEYIDLKLKYKKIINDNILEYIKVFFIKITEKMKIKNKRNYYIFEIIDYINQNYNNDISLDIIAYEYNLTVPHLSRMLKRHLKMSFQNYLNNLRIKKAKSLLKNTSNTLDKIANECGFNSRFSFIRMFKKLEGITPSEYKRLSYFNKNTLN